MGGNQSVIFQQGQPLANYDVVQKVPEHSITYLKHKQNLKEYMIREFAINDKIEFSQTCEKIKIRKKLDSHYLTKLQRFSEQLEDNLCSAFYKIYAMWEYPTHALADQINQRAMQKRRFQENQIFSIIASVIEGMSCLQSAGIKHECLTPNSILFDQTGTVKVADPLTSIMPSNFDRINTNRKTKDVYISPEQCQSLKNQRPIPNRNPYKSDVFILGIIILGCGLLQKMDVVFAQDFEDVNFQQLNSKLDEFNQIYSKDLKLTVETMLTRDPKERMDWIGLKQYVPQKSSIDCNKENHTLNSFGYRNEPYSQNFSQICNKITLGKIQTSLNPDRRQFGVSKNLSLNSYQPISYNLLLNQPLPLNQPFFPSNLNQKITHQCAYQQQIMPMPDLQGGGGNFSYIAMNSNLYSNPKVSNFTKNNKSASQRPTEQISVNNFSKVATGVLGYADKQPFSEFKKDYFSVNPAFNSSYGTNYQSSIQSPYLAPELNGIAIHPISGHFEQNGKSIHNNNDKTSINSQRENSPFLSDHVKDAKSITYEKNLYNSNMTEEKSYFNPHPIENNHQKFIITNNQNQASNGFINFSNYYQPINKFSTANAVSQKINSKSINLNSVLYQPLSSAFGVKEKPNIPQQLVNNSITNQVQKYSASIHNQSSPKKLQQAYQYKQINSTNQTGVEISHFNSGRINSEAYSNNQQQQYVIEHFKQGSRYEGKKYQDMRHGQGKFYYQDGGMYDGNWRFNKMDGIGKLYYQSGKIAYEGNWSEDQFQGFGKLHNQDPDLLEGPFDYQNFDNIEQFWVYYEGNFEADQKDGEGKMIFSNGEYFQGSFLKDMVDGPGKFHRMNGEIIKGTWNQNQLVEVDE